MNFIQMPNLPKSKVKRVIVDYRCNDKILDALKQLNITTYPSCNIKSLYPAVCGHPDMSICHVGKNKFICEPTSYDYYKKTLTINSIELIKGCTYINGTYPYDIAYNIACVSNVAFHKLSCTDNLITENLDNVNFVNVAQGYSKCNTAIISDKAIITEDESIHCAALQSNIDSLLIKKGGISFEGFEYGFIGGSVGLIDKDILAITGNVEKHVDYAKIITFCEKYNVKLYCLTDDIPVDIGSIIPITYE